MTGKRRSLAELATATAAMTTDDRVLTAPTTSIGHEPVAAKSDSPAVSGHTPKRPARRRPVTPARWDEFERKETRLRTDQYEVLTTLSRTLNRQRSGGQRITENTLIRVAIDLLLERKDQLTGNTEDELRKSVTY